MKKITKLLILIVAFAIICGVLAVAAFADTAADAGEGYKLRIDNPGADYPFYANTITEALSLTNTGATITLLDDLHIVTSGAISIARNVTVEMDGHTIYMSQSGKAHGFVPSSKVNVKFMNGTIVNSSNSGYSASSKTQAIFTSIGSHALVHLENVNTYGYAVAYSWGSPYRVTIKGGEHYVYTDYGDLTYGGWICGNNNIIATVENADIYLLHANAYLLGFQNYKATATTAQSLATFYNCKIIASSETKNIISGLNKYTRVAFVKCDIFGKLAPGSTSNDVTKYQSTFSATDNKPIDGSIVLGEGCRVSSNVIGSTAVRWADNVTPASLTKLDKVFTVELQINKPSGYYANKDFAITPTPITVVYTYCDSAVIPKDEPAAPDAPVGDVYKVVSGSSVKYYDASASFRQIVSDASAGSTIYLLRDVTVPTDSTTTISVSKALTFDFGGHTFTFEQHSKNCGFYIKTTSTVTFKNGTITTLPHSDYSTTSTFPFANISTNGANVVFENVSSNVSSVMYSYSPTYTITVNGGKHILSAPRDANTPGFISGQSNITATIKNATLYTNGCYTFGASSYKAIDANKTPLTTCTFENCNIFAGSETANILGAANEYTKIYFNGCYIIGSFSHYLNTQDAEKGVKIAPASNLVIGAGTYFSSKSNITANAALAEGVIMSAADASVVADGTVYKFDLLADYIYATWYNEIGEVIKSVRITPDTNLSALTPAYTATASCTNGWYKTEGYIANKWTDTLGGTKEINISAINASALTESISFYPLVNEEKISAYLSAAMYNLSTTGAIRNHLYIPETPENVEILGVYVGTKEISGSRILFRDHKNAPVYYTMYTIGEVGATEFTKVTNVTIKYRVNGRINLEQDYTLSPQKYANIIYKDFEATEDKKYSDEAYRVVADLVRYSHLLSVYAKITNPELSELYNKMSGLCSALPDGSTLVGAGTDVSALAGAGSIAYEATSYEPRWKFTLNESAKIVDVRITLDGYKSGIGADRTNFGPLSYGIEQISRGTSGYITGAYSENIPIYNIVQPFTITLVKENGVELSGTYSLEAYYNAIKGGANVASFLESVFALADSTVNYKFPEGKVTSVDVSDFWDCDHAGAKVQETVVSYTYVFKPRYCARCDSWLFYYEDYGAVADGKTNRTRATHVSGTNDYEAIYWTHKNANEWKAREELSLGKHVAVIGNSDPKVAKYYYISLPEGRGIYSADLDRDGTPETTYTGKSLGTIVIATDTSWNGVNLIIDDDAICNATKCNCINSDGILRKHAYNSQAIFTLDEYGDENYTENLTSKIKSLSAGATNIGYAPGRKMLIHLTDSNKKIYLRYGSNASNGASITEVILVDEYGNIDPSTPVQWDYATVTSATGYAVDTDPIKVSGLNGDSINASFETYVNNSMSISIPHYVSCGRNITINRSNATIEGIERFFTEEVANSHLSNKRFAYTFIAVSLCSHPTIKDMLVLNHNSQSGESGVGQGSYEFSGGNANAVSWINCVTKNMFSTTKDGATLQAYPVYRGLFGTNHIRNMYLKDCYLNSFDAHTGAYNVTIEDSTVEHMNFIGGGQITIKNVIVYCSSQGMAFNFRTDYGSTWRGDVYVDGLTVRYADETSAKPSRITLFKGSYENQYWGFDTSTPQNVIINDFHIQAYTAVVENGVRTETLGKKDDTENMSVYYYYALTNLSAQKVPTESKPGLHGPTDKGDPNITYDYGTNHLEVTKNLTITNSANIIIPGGSVWKNMNVTVDGEVKKWSSDGDADTGSWS